MTLMTLHELLPYCASPLSNPQLIPLRLLFLNLDIISLLVQFMSMCRQIKNRYDKTVGTEQVFESMTNGQESQLRTKAHDLPHTTSQSSGTATKRPHYRRNSPGGSSGSSEGRNGFSLGAAIPRRVAFVANQRLNAFTNITEGRERFTAEDDNNNPSWTISKWKNHLDFMILNPKNEAELEEWFEDAAFKIMANSATASITLKVMQLLSEAPLRGWALTRSSLLFNYFCH